MRRDGANGEELENAFRKLFDDPLVGYEFLGLSGSNGLVHLGLSQKSAPSSHHDAALKVSMLKRHLMNWVELMGREIDEFDNGEDLVRIRSEAKATLLVLRELNRYFSEVAPATKEGLAGFEQNL